MWNNCPYDLLKLIRKFHNEKQSVKYIKICNEIKIKLKFYKNPNGNYQDYRNLYGSKMAVYLSIAYKTYGGVKKEGLIENKYSRPIALIKAIDNKTIELYGQKKICL